MTEFSLRHCVYRFVLSVIGLALLFGDPAPALGNLAAYQDEAPPVESVAESVDAPQQDAVPDEPQNAENQIDVNENTMEQFVRGLRSLRKYSRLAPEMVELFSPSVGSASASTVRLYSNRKQVAVGLVIGANGMILTKASELKLPLECQLPNGVRVPATVFGVDKLTDLAMLKIEADFPLPSAELRPTPAPPIGRWLASVAVDPKPISLGVVSVFQRKIAAAQARLGIFPDDHEKGVRIRDVTAKSAADNADLMVNDIIIRIGDSPTPDSATLRKVLATFEPGDSVQITILRLDKEITVRVVLSSAEEIDSNSAENPQERMGSTLTRRKMSYPLAFQHDSGLQANQCGSPLVDMDGQIVGINISRAGRVATYALPMEVVVPAVERLLTGQLAPGEVFREELAELEAMIAERRQRLDALPGELANAEQELPRDAAKREELERTIAELQKRVEELQQIEIQRRDSLEAMQDELKRSEIEWRRLQERRERLLQGIR